MHLQCGLGSYSDLDPTLTGGLVSEMEHEGRLEVSSQPSSRNHALPFELLGEIFSYISEDSLDLRFVIFVCRSWHNAVVHHANLWTNITIGHIFLFRFRGARLRHGDAFVRLCLSRSSPCPLRLSVNHPRPSLYGNAAVMYSDECFSLVKHILESNSGEPENLLQRCRSLSWDFAKELSHVDFAVQILGSASFPALEYLTLTKMLYGYPRIGSPRFPRLKEVTLIDHSETSTSPFFHDDDFANAKRLTFCVTSRWVDFDVNTIRRFRNIRILMLKGGALGDEYAETLGYPLKPVEFSLLETLTLSGEVPHQLLNLIRTPRLRKMEIESDSTNGLHSLDAFMLVHLVRSLERLCVSLSQGIRATSWVEELEEVIAEAPSLVGVYVRPWMAQCLIGKEWCTTKLHVMDLK